MHRFGREDSQVSIGRMNSNVRWFHIYDERGVNTDLIIKG
jgi:hypothetical protein